MGVQQCMLWLLKSWHLTPSLAEMYLEVINAFLKVHTTHLSVIYSLPAFLQKQLKEALCTCFLLVLTSVSAGERRQWMLSWRGLFYLWLQRFLAWKISSIPVPFTFRAKQGDKESIHRHNTCDMGQSNGIRTVQWSINEFTVMTAQQC